VGNAKASSCGSSTLSSSVGANRKSESVCAVSTTKQKANESGDIVNIACGRGNVVQAGVGRGVIRARLSRFDISCRGGAQILIEERIIRNGRVTHQVNAAVVVVQLNSIAEVKSFDPVEGAHRMKVKGFLIAPTLRGGSTAFASGIRAK